MGALETFGNADVYAAELLGCYKNNDRIHKQRFIPEKVTIEIIY